MGIYYQVSYCKGALSN